MAASPGIGNRVAPARFLLFIAVAVAAIPLAATWLGWMQGVMAGFDIAALLFLASCLPLFGHQAETMRVSAARNDANRATLLALTALLLLVVLVVIAGALGANEGDKAQVAVLVIATLLLAWLFGNMVFALHYAHLYYTAAADGSDAKGLGIPETAEPDYGDFVYFAFTLGMTFQTSDVVIAGRAMRRVSLCHTLLAFVFNIGVLAFTINVLGGR